MFYPAKNGACESFHKKLTDKGRPNDLCKRCNRPRSDHPYAVITRDTLWCTATGRILAIKDMEDSHLLNCIRCFRGKSPEGTRVTPTDPVVRMEYLNVMANEAYRRGLALDPVDEDDPIHE